MYSCAPFVHIYADSNSLFTSVDAPPLATCHYELYFLQAFVAFLRLNAFPRKVDHTAYVVDIGNQAQLATYRNITVNSQIQ